MTAWVIFSPSLASASAFIFCRIIAETSGGEYSLPAIVTRTSPLAARVTLYGTIPILRCLFSRKSGALDVARLVEIARLDATVALGAAALVARPPAGLMLVTPSGLPRHRHLGRTDHPLAQLVAGPRHGRDVPLRLGRMLLVRHGLVKVRIELLTLCADPPHAQALQERAE